MQLAIKYRQKLSALSFSYRMVLGSLLLFLLLVVLLSAGMGAVEIGEEQLLHILLNKLGLDYHGFLAQQEVVFWHIRLPRIALGVVIGGALAIAGATLQGLFRNPLVEPGLIGVSGGAALCAVLVIVFSQWLPARLAEWLGVYLLPVFAFIGSLLVTLLAYRISRRNGKTDIALLILAGVAINAMAGALIGLAIFYADDVALRSFTFWSLGDLAGASWKRIGFSLGLILLPAVVLIFLYQALDAFALGEAEAGHLGFRVEPVKYSIIILSALTVGASVAMAGMIGFVGLVVPHMVRTVFGPGHRLLLPASFLLGASLLCLADLLARTLVAPSEIPIGVVTSLVGAPFFMGLLIKAKKRQAI